MVTMTAQAIFKCHPSSHHFEERLIRLTESVKIGRSVAKARPTLDNGIFDCKVLSRNHALIWYDSETAKFYLQDTKSSNGTFVNNNRLSRGSEESQPHEVCSGDIVQFGVDVMENSRRGVVTHGCIVAQLSLFHKDGTEATRSDSSLSMGSGFSNQSITGNNNVPSQELYQLSHYLKEALHREQMLEQKLAALQRLVSSTQEATDTSWQALIDEDRLLSRLEVVENQLRAYSKANTEESIRKELVALQEDKSNYEKTVKESLKKALEEKLEACRKVADTELMLNNAEDERAHEKDEQDNREKEQRLLWGEYSQLEQDGLRLLHWTGETNRMLSNSEDERAHVKEELDNLQKEQELLLEKYSQLEKDGQELLQRMGETDRVHESELERLREEQREVQERLGVLQQVETSLGARAEELQGENDFLKEQLLSTKERLEETQEALKQAVGGQSPDRSPDEDPGRGVGSIQPPPTGEEGGKAEEKNPGNVDFPAHHISLMTNGDDRTPTRESGVQVEHLWREATNKELNGRVHDDSVDAANSQSVLTLKNTAEQSVLRQVHRYKYELEEAQQKLEESTKLISGLESEVTQAHRDAHQYQQDIESFEKRLHDAEEHTREAVEKAMCELRERLSGNSDPGVDSGDVYINDNDSETSSIQTLVEEPLIMVREEERQHAAAPAPGSLSSSSLSSSSSSALGTSQDKREGGLHNHIQDTSLSNSADLDSTLLEIDTLKDDLRTLQKKYSLLATENESLSKQVQMAHQDTRIAKEKTSSLQGQLEKAELSAKEANAQLPALQGKLNVESQHVQRQSRELEDLNKKLADASKNATNTQTELSQCRDHITSISGALEREKQVRQKLEQEVGQLAQLQSDVAKERKEREQLEALTKQLQGKILELEERLQKKQEDLKKKNLPSDGGDLKSAMTSLEADLQRLHKEKQSLSQEVERLQGSLKESETERERLSKLKPSPNPSGGDAHAEKEELQRQLTKAQEDLQRLSARPVNDRTDVETLKQRLETVTQELNRSKANNATLQVKWLPVCVIGIAIVAAVFQSLLAMWVDV